MRSLDVTQADFIADDDPRQAWHGQQQADSTLIVISSCLAAQCSLNVVVECLINWNMRTR